MSGVSENQETLRGGVGGQMPNLRGNEARALEERVGGVLGRVILET